MDKDKETDRISADEFGRQSIHRFVQRPGVVQLDAVREQANRASRMVSKKPPLPGHVQRYMSNGTSGVHVKRKLFTYAHPAGPKNLYAGNNIRVPDVVKNQATNQNTMFTALSGGHIQRSLANASVALPVSTAQARDPHGYLQKKSGHTKTETEHNATGGTGNYFPVTTTTISAPIINRHMHTALVMQRAGEGHGLGATATGRGISEGDTSVRSTSHAASNSATPASVRVAGTSATAVTAPSATDLHIQGKKDASTTVGNRASKVGATQNMGLEILQRYEDMTVAKPLNSIQTVNQPASSPKIANTATPNESAAGAAEHVEMNGTAPSVAQVRIQRKKGASNKLENRALGIQAVKNMGLGAIQRYEDMSVAKPLNTRQQASQSDSSSPIATTAMPTPASASFHGVGSGPSILTDLVIQKQQKVPNSAKAGVAKIGSPKNMGSEIVRRHADLAVTTPWVSMRNPRQPDGASTLTTTATPLVRREETFPASVSLGNPALTRIQAAGLPATEINRNQMPQQTASGRTQPGTAGSLTPRAGLEQYIQFNQSAPPLPTLNPASTGQMLFRKQAGNVLPLNGQMQNTGNHSSLYTHTSAMPLASTVNRMSDNNLISRTVDETAPSDEEGAMPAAQSEPAELSITDDLIEKIFSRFMRRVAVETERRGWRS